MFGRRRIPQHGRSSDPDGSSQPALNQNSEGSLPTTIITVTRSNHYTTCNASEGKKFAKSLFKWSSIGILAVVYFILLFQPVDQSIYELTGTEMGSMATDDSRGIVSPLQVAISENNRINKQNELNRKKRIAKHAALVEVMKQKQKEQEEQQQQKLNNTNQSDQPKSEIDGDHIIYSDRIQKNENGPKVTDKDGFNSEWHNVEESKQKSKLRKLYVLGRIVSLWTMVLSCLIIYRYMCGRYFPHWFSSTPMTPFPGARGNRNSINSLRRVRFEMLARRLNDERIANGANPISREALMLAFSRRDFNPNDYEQLLRLNEENGNVMLASIGASGVSCLCLPC